MNRVMTPDADTAVQASGEASLPGGPATGGDSDDLIELLFFAYRDFVGDPAAFDHALDDLTGRITRLAPAIHESQQEQRP